jgi:hypothetical protein
VGANPTLGTIQAASAERCSFLIACSHLWHDAPPKLLSLFAGREGRSVGKVKLKPFFTYFGGKYRIASRYPSPRWLLLIEPFAGSAGYAVRHWDRYVRLYDVNPKVYGTWHYLIHASEEEIYHLPLVFDDVRNLSIPQEAKWLIGWWLNKGHVQPCNLPGYWMRGGTRPNSYWGLAVRDRLASQLKYIRHWRVYNDSYESCPANNAAWFVDPPYQRSGRNYEYNGVDYDSLQRWVLARRGQVIACGQEGDIWLPFSPFVETRGTPGYKMPGTTKEMVWVR